MAGGDGTVGKVARRLIGSRTPLAILPMGTANNIANTLGITGRSLEQLIKGWNTARCINFDAGVAKGPWGSRCFIEGFGTGLFAEVMYQLKGEKNNGLPSSGKVRWGVTKWVIKEVARQYLPAEVVDRKKLDDAVRLLHQTFIEKQGPVVP